MSVSMGLTYRGGQEALDGAALRFWCSFAVLIAMFCLPILASKHVSTPFVNCFVATFQALFALLFVREIGQVGSWLLRTSWLAKAVVFLLLLNMVGWLYAYVPFWGIYRTWVYAAQFMFFLALIGFLIVYGDRAFHYIVVAKVVSVLMAVLIVAFFVAVMPDSMKVGDGALKHPPIYRNLRILNFDVFYCVGLLLFYAYSMRGFIATVALVPSLSLLSVFTVWSAGRGEIVAVAFFCLLVVVFVNKRLQWKNLLLPASAVAAGVGVVVLTNSDYYWYGAASVGDGANVFSAGRVEMWLAAFSRLYDMEALLFGMGPDSFLRLGPVPGAVQAHSVVVQTILEFGIIGAVGPFLILASLAWFSLTLLVRAAEFNLTVAVSALYLSTLLYSTVDGVFYHGLSSAMATVLCAYLVVKTKFFQGRLEGASRSY